MTPHSVPVSDLRNIGATVASRLHAVGIRTRGDLERVGAVSAYCEMRHRFPETRLSLCCYLYSLEGALRDEHWDIIGPQAKRELREAVKRFVH